MRILVIEDEARLAGFVQQGLGQAGHVADVADNGATGLEMAAALPYDLRAQRSNRIRTRLERKRRASLRGYRSGAIASLRSQ